MLYPRDHRAADILLGQRPSQKKKLTYEATGAQSKRLTIAALAIVTSRELSFALFTPLKSAGKKHHKRFQALLHIRSRPNVSEMVLRRIFEDLKFLNTK